MSNNRDLIIAAEDLGWEEGIDGLDRTSFRAGIRHR